MKKIIVAITGASGTVLGIRLLKAMKEMPDVETELILSDAAHVTLFSETDSSLNEVEQLAGKVYKNNNIGAEPASGSYAHDGMMVVPCSIKTLSAVANCYSSDLISRSADVTLKEGRKLLLAVRETPLHKGHLDLMSQCASMGVILFPPIPAFYTSDKTMDEMVENLVGRMMMRMGLENKLYQPWDGLGSSRES